MDLKNFVRVLAKRRGGARVLGGIAAVLVGVERLMTPSHKRATERRQAVAGHGATVKPVVRSNFFSIRQTKSEFGYTYWVVQGHGVYASFELFDTWPEAMAAVEARLSATISVA